MRSLLILASLLWSFAANATAIDCFAMPGGSGDYITYGASNAHGHFRTGAGFPAYTIGAIVSSDTLSPGFDKWVFQVNRSSNGDPNHGLQFDDSGDQISYTFNQAEQFGSVSISATTFYLVALVYEGDGGDMIVHVIASPSGTVVDQDNGASGGSSSAHSSEQTVNGGATYSGSSPSGEWDGVLCSPFIIKNNALNATQLQAMAADPLNTGDDWVTTYGSNLTMWLDDTGTDQSLNGITPTLNGSVTLGSGNGPDVPERSAGGGGAAVTIGRRCCR